MDIEWFHVWEQSVEAESENEKEEENIRNNDTK